MFNANRCWQLSKGLSAMGKRAEGAPRARVRFRPHTGFVMVNALFAAVFVALVLSAFHAPSPHGLPVGIVAPATVTGQLEKALGSAAPGGFDLRVYPSEAAARYGIAHDELDGALVDASGGLRLLVAQAAGTAPTQALTGAFSAVAARSGRSLTVTDVVPPLPGDSLALSPFFIVLGVLFPSLVAGSASALVFRRARPAWCVAAPAVAAVVAGVIAAGIADGIAGLGSYPAIAGIVALFALAVAAPTAALGRLWPPLVTAAVLAFVVVGIPASGGPSGLASFVPGFLRVLHPALPLGAAASAVRGAVYFHGYGTAGPLWALTAWAVAGLAALIVITVRRQASAARTATAPAPAAAPAAAAPAAPAAAAADGNGRYRAIAPESSARRRPARQAEAAPDSVPALAAATAALTDAAGQSSLDGQGECPSAGIVAGFDNSDPARRALGQAARLAAARHRPLHVVYADHPVVDSDLSGFGYAEMEAVRDRKAAAVAEAAADIVGQAGVTYTFERRQDTPADAILSAASALAATDECGPVIVVGRSGRAARHPLGSAATHLLHHSPYPVLTIP